jgi:hypothetical protein
MKFAPLLLTLISLPAAGEVWTEGPLVNLFSDSAPSPRADETIRLYAARGERESFQIAINGGRRGLRIKEVRGEPPSEGFAEPEIRRVGYLRVETPSRRAYRGAGEYPDPLLDFQPFEVPPKETRALWVTYTVPRDARPGRHKGQIEIVPEKGAKRRVSVTLEVFDFTLPETPSLRTSFSLDRERIRRTYGILDEALDAWKPIYDALSDVGISYSLWTGDGLVKVRADGMADATSFKDHLAYAVERGRMAAIDVGMGEAGIAAFPEPPEGVVQDPLQLYLLDIDGWLASKGWLDRAILQPMPPQETVERQEARKAYFRVWRADKRVRRLVVGALHPSLERYTDIWAVPLRYYQPFAQERVRQGYSLRAEPAHEALAVEASSSGGGETYAFTDTMPVEAYDGSLFTSWVSAVPPAKRNPQWLRIDLVELAQADRIRIGWKPGLEPKSIRVETSYDGRVYNEATTRWDHHPAGNPFDQSWSEGRFRSPKTFQSIYFEFEESANGGPIGITEIELGAAPDPETVERIDPLEIWTYSLKGDFPSLSADAHPTEARLAAWVCWGHDADGFYHRGLNRWPEGWARFRDEAPEVWTDSGDTSEFLYYPGPAAPIPSIRIERLRDGIEDYEYLKALKAAAGKGAAIEPGLREWLVRRLYPVDATPEELDGMRDRVHDIRVGAGIALTRLAKEAAKKEKK